MKKVFRSYAEADMSMLEGFAVAKVNCGVNAMDSGMYMELERKVDNVVLGIDVIYDPDNEDGEPEFAISNEFVRHIE